MGSLVKVVIEENATTPAVRCSVALRHNAAILHTWFSFGGVRCIRG